MSKDGDDMMSFQRRQKAKRNAIQRVGLLFNPFGLEELAGTRRRLVALVGVPKDAEKKA